MPWAQHESSHESPLSTQVECLFCSAVYQGKHSPYYKHISAHLREISLSVLPQPDNDDDGFDTDESDLEPPLSPGLGIGTSVEARDEYTGTEPSANASTNEIEHPIFSRRNIKDIYSERPHPDRPGESQYLIKWYGFPLDECTWEPIDGLEPGLLEQWEKKKQKIAAGEAEPFEVEVFNAARRAKLEESQPLKKHVPIHDYPADTMLRLYPERYPERIVEDTTGKGIDLDSIIDRLLDVRGSRPGKQVKLPLEEIRFLCTRAIEVLLSQPMLLELEGPIKVSLAYSYPKLPHLMS